jgi:hypothetical protein
MDKRFGTVLGGDDIEFIGTGFKTSSMRFLDGEEEITASVLIDGRSCDVSTQTETSIICRTSDKPYKEDVPTLQINIEGMGNVATKGKIFRYL